ncbi:hypothetical protein NDU88_000179 [Pleurodeles waltl]|uniref:Uncharacterized protein n=1 Tax=Pleurodeles waltl TaxID=8319 RepID=A0AAV7TE83_PLEWA|nr:hypothetical protein NDU88_000179 [Pleurodeles waltl]
MDSDLLEEWRMQTADCSTKLMGTLITQAKRRMEEQIIKIEQLTKELEKMPNKQEISNQLAKMEERIKYKEEEIKSRKAHKFNRDKMDYEHGRIYTFARKYDTARIKDMSKSGADCAVQHISADDSSEIESSADEIPRNKLDFQGGDAPHANGHATSWAISQAWPRKRKTRRGKKKKQSTIKLELNPISVNKLNHLSTVVNISHSTLTISYAYWI